jgi:phage host-nuclease inhibitor protein Gam
MAAQTEAEGLRTRIQIPRKRATAIKLLARVGRTERKIRVLDAQRDRELAPHQDAIVEIRERYDREIEPLLPTIDRLLEALWYWYVENLHNYDDGRLIKLPTGTLGMKLDGQWKVEYLDDKQKVLKALRRRGTRFVKRVDSPIANAIIAERHRLRNVKGLLIHRCDRFFAQPDVLHKLPKPENDRLRVAVVDITE